MIRFKFGLLFLCLFFSLQTWADNTSLRSIWLNRQGVRLLKEQRPEEALSKWSEALSLEPESSEIHLNMGLAFEALGQSEKALQAFATAGQFADSAEMQFRANFNRGAILQKAKKIDEALSAYHAALDVNPESKEAKINIELLIQDQQNQQKQGDGKSDQSNPSKDQKPKDDKDKKDNKDGQGDQKKDKPKEYSKNKPQPRPFKSDELTQGDVNKIMGEIRNQEQKIRSEYNKREVKERPRDKDW